MNSPRGPNEQLAMLDDRIMYGEQAFARFWSSGLNSERIMVHFDSSFFLSYGLTGYDIRTIADKQHIELFGSKYCWGDIDSSGFCIELGSTLPDSAGRTDPLSEKDEVTINETILHFVTSVLQRINEHSPSQIIPQDSPESPPNGRPQAAKSRSLRKFLDVVSKALLLE